MNKRYFLSILVLITGLSAAVNAWAATDFVPGLEFLQLPANANIGEVLARLYIWGISFAALAAFGVFTFGGIKYLTAGDRDPSEARTLMWGAIQGLLLALGSYLILNTINPALVNIKNLDLPPINQVSSPSTPPLTEEQKRCAALTTKLSCIRGNCNWTDKTAFTGTCGTP